MISHVGASDVISWVPFFVPKKGRPFAVSLDLMLTGLTYSAKTTVDSKPSKFSICSFRFVRTQMIS